MSNPIEKFWTIRLNDLKQVLEKNNFEVFIADSLADAKAVFDKQIVPSLGEVKSVAFGGSGTLSATGIVEDVRANEAELVMLGVRVCVSRWCVHRHPRRPPSRLASSFLAPCAGGHCSATHASYSSWV